MKAGSRFFKMIASKAPRLRGFSSHFFFGHPFLDAWFAWFPLNQIQYDGAAVGEIFKVASQIDERSTSSWITEWTGEGDRLSTYAEGLLKEEHTYSASRAFLRAYTYYRTAHLATDPGFYPKEMKETYERLLYCFDRFRELSGLPIEKVQVPLRSSGKSGHQQMHGYFLRSLRDTAGTAPTLVWLNGAESLVEDVYWWCGREGIDRGFNVFAVDAPGDTATRIYNPELLIAGAGDRALLSQIDYLLAQPEVDSKKIYVYGISMGGYKASRLGQIDDRVQGIVANAPMLNAARVLDATRNVYKAPKDAHGWANRMCWQYGVDYSQNLKMALQILVDDVWGEFVVDPSKITVPFLTLAGEKELGEEGIRQANEFHQKILSPVCEKRITTEAEGASAHCQLDNFPLARQIVFDWIEMLSRRSRMVDEASASTGSSG